MICSDVVNLLSTWMDGELTGQQAEAVQKHVASCPSCDALAVELRQLHRDIQEQFQSVSQSGSRVADRVVNQLPLQTESVVAVKRSSPWPSVASIVASVAAGFVLAMCTIPRDRPPLIEKAEAIVVPATFAAVGASTGPLEVSPIAGSVFARHDSPLLAVGMKLRTGKHKSEFVTPAGATIRLDADTEVSFPTTDELVLESGRMWCRTGENAAKLAISSCGTTIEVAAATCDVSCDADGGELIALAGEVRIVGNDWQSNVQGGKKVSFTSRSIVETRAVTNAIIETRWVHDLLRQRPRHDGELEERVEKLWASLGYSKLRYLYVDELRAIGSSCVGPLTAFLASEKDIHQKDHRRGLAAEIVGDVADFGTLERLVDLLNDRDAEVRMHMARGLKRITGRDLGLSPDQWRNASVEERTQGVTRWRTWLQNRAQSARTPWSTI